jgi:hypothetical protein
MWGVMVQSESSGDVCHAYCIARVLGIGSVNACRQHRLGCSAYLAISSCVHLSLLFSPGFSPLVPMVDGLLGLVSDDRVVAVD